MTTTSLTSAPGPRTAPAASISARCVSACGKFPSSSREPGSISSENSPTSFEERNGLVHQLARLVAAAGARERLHEPEGAGEEGALELLRAAVAVDERAVGELFADGCDRPGHPLALWIGELGPRGEQHGGVELVRVGIERVAAAALGPAAGLDEVADPLALAAPVVGLGARDRAALRQLERAVERDPAVHFRARVVLQVVELPDPGVLLHPDAAGEARHLRDPACDVGAEVVAVLDVHRDRLEQVAVAAELKLRRGRVALADWARAAVARKRELFALVGDASVEVVEHVEPRMRALDRVQQPAQRGMDELQPPDAHERVDREGRVAHPREAVVPVAVAADLLGKRRCRGGGHRSRRRVSQQLERERAAQHLVRPGPVVLVPLDPALPPLRRRAQAPLDAPAVGRGKRAVDAEDEREERRAAVGELEPSVPRIPGVQLEAPAGLLRGSELPLHVDAAGDAFDLSYELEPGEQLAVVGRERVRDAQDAARGVEGRLEDVGLRQVPPRDGELARGREPERAAAPRVEERVQERLGGDVRHRQPVDRPVRRDQRDRPAVADDGVVGDRGVPVDARGSARVLTQAAVAR